MFSPSEEALLLECLNNKIQEVAGFNTEAFQYFLMVGTFLPGGGPGGEVGRLFKDQTCVFGQTQVVDPRVMNDKTPPPNR